ncbi:MAG: SMP-30/gluconolactonase/LRE family protein [Moraxella sp.]|uniref:SMP-30/gluconolactonase/LRE family protein n=1 Tax=Moraxella sp. TaxID=479 RepID=UPI0026DCC954|nr:SMP-30/gluconolactonase/LRE family protein [Moraxella sp.]MDO4451183.1 SMP-30/gluconolactonase/LRE family protein [Moraxella sp.]
MDATYQNGFGVLAVARADKGYQPEILVDNYQGERFGMIDALTIAQNGDIYFTDASKGVVASENDQYGAHFIGVVDAFANTQSGSVYVYRPSTGKTEKLVSGLRFANGMQLVDDEKFLLLNETFGNRVLKIDTQVRDAKVGDAGVSVLVDNIPAILDNMTRSANGKIWVGMPSAVLLKFSKGQQSHSAMAFSMDENGQVQDFYVDESGKFSRVTGVNETENRLYFQHVGHNSLLPYVEK